MFHFRSSKPLFKGNDLNNGILGMAIPWCSNEFGTADESPPAATCELPLFEAPAKLDA
jgi:hypothetical protein